MKRLSLKNLSLLGLVLMGASAVTAAVLPKDNSSFKGTGDLVEDSTAGQLTCKAGAVDECTYSVTDGIVSTTSAAAANTSATLGASSAGFANTTDV